MAKHLGMKQHKGRSPTQGLNLFDGRVINQADTKLEHIATGSLYKQRTLPNRELRLSCKPVQSGLQRRYYIAVVLPQFVIRRAELTFGVDILPLVLTDQSFRRRLLSLFILVAASNTNVFRHLWSFQYRLATAAWRREFALSGWLTPATDAWFLKIVWDIWQGQTVEKRKTAHLN